MNNQITLESGKPMAGFINVGGVSQDTSVDDHNKAMNEFIKDFNDGKLAVKAFIGNNDKIVIGFQ